MGQGGSDATARVSLNEALFGKIYTLAIVSQL